MNELIKLYNNKYSKIEYPKTKLDFYYVYLFLQNKINEYYIYVRTNSKHNI